MSLNAIRTEMIARQEVVGGDVTDSATVEQHLAALEFDLDRFHAASIDQNTGETLCDPDEAEMSHALSALIKDALRATIALGLRLDFSEP